MGSQFVPNSPKVTAEMMAGQQALAQLAAAAAAQAQSQSQGQGQGKSPSQGKSQSPSQGEGQPGEGQPGEGQPGEGQPSEPGQPALASAKSKGGGTSKGGTGAPNPDREQGALEVVAGKEGGDSRVPDGASGGDMKARAFESAPWFAKLPKELRDAIRAKSRREPPKGYEETLRRYYESIE
jgi:hypothetical protein